MARKPTKRIKKPVRGKRNNGTFLTIALAFLAMATLCATVYFVVLKRTDSPDFIDKTVETLHKQLPEILYEESEIPVLPTLEPGKHKEVPGGKRHAQQEAEKPRALSLKKGERPKVAIIIDDMGYRKKIGEDLLKLDVGLSFAFLPYGPHTDSLVAMAQVRGREILLHLPMEPADGKVDPGEGALVLAMSAREIHDRLEKDLASVYMAAGINNHMGSRFTQNREAMTQFLALVKQHEMFFLDSYTSQHSLGMQIARDLRVPTARRDVFLDNDRDRGKIKTQIRRLVELAEKQGWAIGIGHPHDETYEALRDSQRLLQSRVRMVKVEDLVR